MFPARTVNTVFLHCSSGSAVGTIGINTEDLLGLCSGGLLKARQSRRAAKGAECCLSFFLQRNDPKGLGPCIWLGPLRIGYTLGTQCFSM